MMTETRPARRLRLKQPPRTHVTPVKLNKYNSNTPDNYFKNDEFQGTFIHRIWECGKIKNFWMEVINKSGLSCPNIPLDSKMILLHLYPTDLNLRIEEYEFIDFATLQAKRTLPFNWEKTEAPAIGAWIQNIAQCMSTESMTYTLKNRLDAYEGGWKPFDGYINNGDIGELQEEKLRTGYLKDQTGGGLQKRTEACS